MVDVSPFLNRLAKNYKHLAKWARRQEIEAWRVYDRDIPQFPLAVDLYGARAQVYEYDTGWQIDDDSYQAWLDAVLVAINEVTGIGRDAIAVKTRRRQKGVQQYEKLSAQRHDFVVGEQGQRFWVNLDDYLDTGLFLDHRNTRRRVREEIREFLFKTWAEVLALSAVRDGAQHADTVAFKHAAADLVWSRVFKEYPTLRVALSEGGTGWIPYFLDRLDRTYDMHSSWTGQDFKGKLPSEVFLEHFMTCFIADPIGLQLRNEIGIDNICWEMDYPHSDSSWPEAPEEFAAACEKYGVTDAEIDKITHENAMKWYQFDPYSIRPRETCTTVALRAEAEGHDVSVKSYDTGGFERSSISLGELAGKATA